MPSPTFELKNSMVRAGAGAGKTSGLVNKVVEVYRQYRLNGLESPRIVLTTFTRKATQELKERLIKRACEEKDAALLQFVSDPARLHIATIHGLLNVFLKQVGHLAGLDSGFQIISEPEGAHLARLALREVMVSTPEHLRWLEIYGFSRLLTMCRRYQALAREQGELRPASREDLRQVVRVEGLRWKEAFTKLIQNIRATSDDEAWRLYASLLQGMIHEWGGEGSLTCDLPSKPRRSKKFAHLEPLFAEIDDLLGDFKKAIDKPCWNEELWPAMLKEWQDFQPLAIQFSAELEKLKEGQARFEMNDLELKSLEILRGKPFLGAVFSEAWDFWMIDEYQDTSPLQVELLKNLIGDKPKYVVGDPQQSIYLFRGAEVGVFRDAENAVTSEGGEIQELLKNYRSSPDLLLWINDFMSTLGAGFMRMQPRALATPPIQSCVTFWHAPDEESELRGLATRVQQLLDQGARLDEICVLGRTHRNLMEVSRVLKDLGFPTHVHSSRGFSARREVLDAQALWKFLLNPHDNLNLMTLLRSPWFLVEDWQLTEWMKDRPQSLWRRLYLNEKHESVARLKLCLERLEREGLVRTFEWALCANAYLDLSLANDPAGRKESNLWKLINKAQALEKEGGKSPLDLLQAAGENPMEATEGDATSAQEPNCINLMTIHGSKGLEFEHVLIPRMGESPRTSQTQALQGEGGVFFFPVWQEDLGEFVSSPLDFKSVLRQRERELEEFDRWLYVALTRAKKTLTLSWSTSGRESWVERSSWFRKEKGDHQTAEYAYSVIEELPPATFYRGAQECDGAVREPFAAQSANGLEARHSVSELVEREVTTRAAPEDLLRRWQAQALGTRIHRVLESLKYREIEAPSDESVRYVLQLKDPPLCNWITHGHAEWGFQVKGRNGVVEGQIDLWVKDQGKLFVVDYKSGSPAFKEAAFRQLSLYAWALRKFGHQEPAVLVVVYPLLKKTETRPFDEALFLHWERELGGA